MNRSRFAFVIVLILALALPLFAADRGAKSVDAAWMKAMKANDLDGVMACYAADAELWFPGAPEASGAKAIRALYQGFFAANTVQSVATTDTHYRTSGSLSAGWGEYTLTIVPKAGGSPITMHGRFTEVAALHDGHWAYIADHASADPEPAK